MTNNDYGLPHEPNRMLNFYKNCPKSLALKSNVRFFPLRLRDSNSESKSKGTQVVGQRKSEEMTGQTRERANYF